MSRSDHIPVHTGTYWVPWWYFVAYSCINFSSFRKGTYQVHADSGGVPILGSWFYCAPASPPSRIQAPWPAHALNQITLKHWQVYSLLLGTVGRTLVSVWAPGRGRWRLAGGFSCCWSAASASPDSPPPWSAVCSPAAPAPASNALRAAKGRVKDLGFKLGRQWWAAKYLSNPAKFRDLIRETK